MGFWIFMLICCLLVPCTLLIIGHIFKNNPPKTISNLYGYRTPMSKKNMDTWTFAHTYCGALWIKTGRIMLPLSVVCMLPFLKASTTVVSAAGSILTCVQTAILLLSTLSVERTLKKTFDADGQRRQFS